MPLAFMVDLRRAVYETINEAKQDLPITTFEVSQTYLPLSKLEESPVNGKVFISGSSWGANILSRRNDYDTEVPIQVAFLQHVDPTDTEYMDKLTLFIEQLMEKVIQTPHDVFSCIRVDSITDEHDRPYLFGLLRKNTYIACFSAVFKAGIAIA